MFKTLNGSLKTLSGVLGSRGYVVRLLKKRRERRRGLNERRGDRREDVKREIREDLRAIEEAIQAPYVTTGRLLEAQSWLELARHITDPERTRTQAAKELVGSVAICIMAVLIGGLLLVLVLRLGTPVFDALFL